MTDTYTTLEWQCRSEVSMNFLLGLQNITYFKLVVSVLMCRVLHFSKKKINKLQTLNIFGLSNELKFQDKPPPQIWRDKHIQRIIAKTCLQGEVATGGRISAKI